MAVFDSPITTYSDTTTQKRVITDVISLIDPSDAPAIEALGGLDGARSKFRFVNEKETTVEWLEDTLLPLVDALTTTTVTSVATTLNITDGSIYQPGHILLIDSEQLWVSAAAVATNIITVSRGQFGSTAATHTSTAVVYMIGMARLEGASSDPIAFTDRTTNSNWSQILHQEVKVTRTQQHIAQYGISDEMAYQGDKVVPSLMRLLERHFYYNKAGSLGSASAPRLMGGYQAFITTNLIDGSSLTQAKIETAVLACYNAGSNGPWIALCTPTNRQKIKNFYDTSLFLRVDRTETTLGMNIDRIVTPFGDVDLITDRWAVAAQIAILDPKHIGFYTFDPFFQEPLAKDGDYDKSEVVGEFTLCLRPCKAHAVLTAVS